MSHTTMQMPLSHRWRPKITEVVAAHPPSFSPLAHVSFKQTLRFPTTHNIAWVLCCQITGMENSCMLHIASLPSTTKYPSLTRDQNSWQWRFCWKCKLEHHCEFMMCRHCRVADG